MASDRRVVHQAYRFALDPTPAQRQMLAQNAGAARFVFNSMLGEVKANLSARDWERRLLGAALTDAQGWSLPALRRTWNANKDQWAPWWRECSKEAFNTGLDGLARALKNWKDSQAGRRAGEPERFPRFRKRARRDAIRFTTGPRRVEPDRHHVVLPRLGRIRTHESTRKLTRRVEQGTARILAATVTRQAHRWFVSFTCLVERRLGREAVPGHIGRSPHRVVGVDVGISSLATIAAPDGSLVAMVANPRPLQAAQERLRHLQRRIARQKLGSVRRSRTRMQIAQLHARVVNVRQDALAKLTTRLAQQHDVIVVERLRVPNMVRASGARKHGLNRAIVDSALGKCRRLLTYKAPWYGSRLVEADPWYPSSKTCSACGVVKAKLTLSERAFDCEHCGAVLDRDWNAAINLARLGETQTRPAGRGPVAGRGADRKTGVAAAAPAGGSEASTPSRRSSDRKVWAA